MKKTIRVWALSLMHMLLGLAGQQSVLAADAALPAGCAQVFPEAADQAAIVRFQRDLRAAVAARDAAAFALLVSYPLKINGPGQGARTLLDAAAVQEDFPRLLAVIGPAVLNPVPDGTSCLRNAIMWARGAFWVQPDGAEGQHEFWIDTVNLTTSPTNLPPGSLAFICRTAKFRVVVDSEGKGSWRYRAWGSKKALADAPDLTLRGGVVNSEGSGACAYDVWTFRSGNVGYAVGGLGCTDGHPPQGTVGTLSVTVGQNEKLKEFCR